MSRGPNRRIALRAGAIALGGMSLDSLFRATARGESTARDRSVIVVWVHGGPSHLETFDLKPDAPSDTRSIYKPIDTNVPGVRICEHLPRLATLADRYTLVRSIAHDEADHGFGTRRMCTGFADSVGGNGVAKYPAYECAVNHALGKMRGGLPVSTNLGGFAASTPWRGAGVLGAQFEVPQNSLQNAALAIPRGLFDDRKNLLKEFDRTRTEIDSRQTLATADVARRQAYDVLTSGKAATAYDLAREDPRVRDRYRDIEFEQGLLALRLVEAGVNLVNVYFPGRRSIHAEKTKAYDWDDHAVNWNMDVAMRLRLPWFDACLASLIGDLHDRGLDEKTLVLVTGEFGRTPRLENMNGNVGRDHWPGAMSVLVAGGGRKRGDVLGATNARGEHPVGFRHDPVDFLATIYHWLGIDPARHYFDLTGRPLPYSSGKPIDGII